MFFATLPMATRRAAAFGEEDKEDQMGVLTSQQTTQAVRGLLYFGAHDYNGVIDLYDCSAELKTDLETVSEPNADKEEPIDEEITVEFFNVRHDGRLIDGRITVSARIRWPNLHERMRIGSPNYRVTAQPSLSQRDLTKNCLVAFSRLIAKHNEEVRAFREREAEAAPAKS